MNLNFFVSSNGYPSPNAKLSFPLNCSEWTIFLCKFFHLWMQSYLPTNVSLHEEGVKLSCSFNAQLYFPTNPSHKGKGSGFFPLNAQQSFPVKFFPHGEEVKLSLHLMHSYPSTQILPHMGKDVSSLPPKYKTNLDHMGNESSFLLPKM